MTSAGHKHYLQLELEDLIRKDPRIFEFLHNGVLDGLWYWDIEHPEQEWMNDQFWRFLGYDPGRKAPLAKEWQDLIHPDDLEPALKNFHAHCADPRHPYDQIVRYKHANGSTAWVRCRGMAIRDADGKAVRMLGMHVGLTELKEAEQRLQTQANELFQMQEQFRILASRDELTGLYNRRALYEHAEWAFLDACRRRECISILLIDVDNFKKVNDSFGHLVGDTVLATIATVLQDTSRAHDFVARYGGEEMVVLLPNTNIEDSQLTGERIRLAVMDSTNLFVNVTVSIGAATVDACSDISEPLMALKDLLAQADKALYLAKHNGRNCVCHFLEVVPSAP
jgi:diguanylate cyclase (GGDEF)-like protein/PAS domain S-box-containing protein